MYVLDTRASAPPATRSISARERSSSLRHQRGMSLWGWMFVLGVFGFVVYTGLMCFGKYMEYFDVRNAIHWAAAQPELVKATPTEIRKRIQRRIDTGYIEVVDAKMVKVRRIKNSRNRELHIEWEVRENFAGNIDLVWAFEVTQPITGKSPD